MGWLFRAITLSRGKEEADENYFCLRYRTGAILQSMCRKTLVIFYRTRGWVKSLATSLSCLMCGWGDTDAEIRLHESSWPSPALLINPQYISWLSSVLWQNHKMTSWSVSVNPTQNVCVSILSTLLVRNVRKTLWKRCKVCIGCRVTFSGNVFNDYFLNRVINFNLFLSVDFYIYAKAACVTIWKTTLL